MTIVWVCLYAQMIYPVFGIISEEMKPSCLVRGFGVGVCGARFMLVKRRDDEEKKDETPTFCKAEAT